jgi:hypothetical protein
VSALGLPFLGFTLMGDVSRTGLRVMTSMRAAQPQMLLSTERTVLVSDGPYVAWTLRRNRSAMPTDSSRQRMLPTDGMIWASMRSP